MFRSLRSAPCAEPLCLRARHLRVPLAAAAAAAFLFCADAADAAGLLAPAPAEASTAAGDSANPMAIRQRVAAIDYAYMESNMVPLGIDRTADRLQQAPAAGPLRLELFPDVTVTLQRDGLRRAPGGGYEWSGRVPGEPFGFGVFIVSGGDFTAQIQSQGKLYRLEPAGDGLIRVLELDWSKFPEDIIIPAPSNGDAAPDDAAAPEAAEATRRVRVLVPYTPRARDEAPNILQDIKLAIALANRGYKNSQINFRVVLAKALLTNYDESVGFSQTLSDLRTGSQASMRQVRAQRNKTKADLVAMLIVDSQYCGLGYYIENPARSTRDYGYSVTWRSCISNHTVAHEMGHNQGLLHDRYVHDPAPNSKINYGYVNLQAKVRTIMAYNNECVANGFNCERIPFFSTPKVKYRGKTIGVAKGRPGAAAAATRLNQTSKAISNYR